MDLRNLLVRFLGSLPSGLLALGLAAGAPSVSIAAEVELTYAFFAPAGTFPAKQMAHWVAEVEKRTKGKVKVKMFPSGTLLGAREMYDGVAKGVADIGLGAPSYDPGRFPLSSGVSLPVGFSSATVGSRVLWELTQEFKPKEFEQFKVIAMFTSEPSYIMSRTPVRNAENLKGMKLRAVSTGVPVLKALGAAPVGMPMPDVPQAVQTAVIDGLMTGRDVLKDFKLAGPLKYVTDYPNVVVTFAAVMDRKRWDRLPSDVQKTIEDLAPEMAIWTGHLLDDEVIKDTLEWSRKEEGLQIVSLDAGERARWDAKLKPLEDEWIAKMTEKGLPAKQYMNRLHELRDQLEKK